MVVNINNYEFIISYVWDGGGRNEYLVIDDKSKKLKFIPDTQKVSFDENDVHTLIVNYAKNVLHIPGEITYTTSGTIDKVAHYHDYIYTYKRSWGYKTKGYKQCKELELVY